MFTLIRPNFLPTSAATIAATSISAPAFAADPIAIGVPTAQSEPVRVVDQADWLNGVTMAVKENLISLWIAWPQPQDGHTPSEPCPGSSPQPEPMIAFILVKISHGGSGVWHKRRAGA